MIELEQKKVRIIDVKELTSIFMKCSAYVKYVVGIANNAAWAACLESMEMIKSHPYYLCQRKGGTTPAHEFRRCFDALHKYERNLIYTEHNRFFHLADMPPKVRAYYAEDLTDRDYYDYWCAFGFTAFDDNRAWYTNLVNKFRLAYEAHRVPNAEQLAWANAAGQALRIASEIYITVMDNCSHDFPVVNRKVFDKVFHSFYLGDITKMWSSAFNYLDPSAENIPLTETEFKNIQHGYEQLAERWVSNEAVFGSRVKTAEAYADIFRTRGTMKKNVEKFRRMKEQAK